MTIPTALAKERRLFIGIPVPGSMSKTLMGLDPEKAGIRWLDPNVHHITLCFIGETKMEPHEEVLPVLREECRDLAPFSLPFEGIVRAPKKRPYMIWARFGLREEFRLLHDRLFRRFLPGKDEPNDPVPHITLARARRGRIVQEEELPDAPELPDLHVDKLLLWWSELRKGGAVHHALGEADLDGNNGL